MKLPGLIVGILLVLSSIGGCASTGESTGAEPGRDPGLLKANNLPAGEDHRPKCPAGETMMCESRYRVSDGRTAVDRDEDQAHCRCRPMSDLRNIW